MIRWAEFTTTVNNIYKSVLQLGNINQNKKSLPAIPADADLFREKVMSNKQDSAYNKAVISSIVFPTVP